MTTAERNRMEQLLLRRAFVRMVFLLVLGAVAVLNHFASLQTSADTSHARKQTAHVAP